MGNHVSNRQVVLDSSRILWFLQPGTYLSILHTENYHQQHRFIQEMLNYVMSCLSFITHLLYEHMYDADVYHVQ